MKKRTVGIIAEYNPFHNGHIYHINMVKKMFPDSLIVLILGGNFTQRGEISFLDKWDKTKIALKYGVDLVVELPFPFTVASSDIFANASLELCHYLQVTDLVFGSESSNINSLKELATCQLHNPLFNDLVKVYLKEGSNYPTALSKALESLTNKSYKLPNDILGISYIKAIIANNYDIIPHTIKRTTDYHDINLKGKISSATSIRKALLENQDIKEVVPKETNETLKHSIPNLNNYFLLLKYKIISSEDLTIYNLVDSNLNNRLKKERQNATDLDDLIKRVKTKNLTYARLNRILIYILCSYKKEDAKNFKHISYIRVLGFTTAGKSHLNTIKKDLTIPLISKFTKDADPIFDYTYQTVKIYSLGFPHEISNNLISDEYKKIPIKEI